MATHLLEPPAMVTVLTPVVVGSVEVFHHTVSRVESMMSGLHPGQFCPEGQYVVLKVNGDVMMSDTRMERITNSQVIRRAKGNVLMAGLGIGMTLLSIAQNPAVDTVVVVEKSPDVAQAVWPQLKAALGTAHEKVTLVLNDIHKFRPSVRGRQFDVIWHDIWPWVNADMRPEMTKLKRTFAPYLKVGGWQACWKEAEARQR